MLVLSMPELCNIHPRQAANINIAGGHDDVRSRAHIRAVRVVRRHGVVGGSDAPTELSTICGGGVSPAQPAHGPRVVVRSSHLKANRAVVR